MIYSLELVLIITILIIKCFTVKLNLKYNKLFFFLNRDKEPFLQTPYLPFPGWSHILPLLGEMTSSGPGPMTGVSSLSAGLRPLPKGLQTDFQVTDYFSLVRRHEHHHLLYLSPKSVLTTSYRPQ